jgi:competence protein ComEA
MRKHFLSGYFSFTKKERTGVIVLLSFIAFFMLLPFAFPFFNKQQTFNPIEIKQVTEQLDSNVSKPKRYVYKKYIPQADSQQEYKPQAELFYFDPNTIDKEGWEKLGLRDKTIATIQNYLSKGGKFYKPEDIKKIWGLSSDEATQLIPYIRIAVSKQASRWPLSVVRSTNNHQLSTLDINTADTTAFIALPGIGNKLANRIVQFRDKLGGFHTIDQVGETYALPDSTFQKIRPRLVLNDSTVKQININTVTLDELKAHPYIRYYLANAIIQYRNQHGNFLSVDDLKKILLITNDAFIKMRPYLKISD